MNHFILLTEALLISSLLRCFFERFRLPVGSALRRGPLDETWVFPEAREIGLDIP